MKAAFRPKPPASVVALVLCAGLAACVANSGRQFRGRAVREDDPWPRLQRAWTADAPVAPAELQAGLQQLEDLVEHAASEVFGRDVDFPTPELFPGDQLVSVLDRSPLSSGPHSLHLEPWLQHADSWGLKFLLDHSGAASFGDLSESERSDVLRLCSAVGSVVRDSDSPYLARDLVHRLEQPVFESLGLTQEAVRENERRFDTSVWQRSAFTLPVSSAGGPRVYLSLEILGEPGVFPAFAYAHELFHALVFSQGNRLQEGGRAAGDPGGDLVEAGWSAITAAEARLAVHEQSAQVFAKLVLDELRESGAMGDLEVISFENLPGSGSDQSPREDQRWQRLFSLYRSTPERLASERLIAARYGYGEDLEQLKRIDESMQALGVQRLIEGLAKDMQAEALAPMEHLISRPLPAP